MMKTVEHRWRSRKLSCLCLSVFIIVAVSSGSPALADEAEPVLEKYKEEIDKSLDKALGFLARSQLKDGSFESGMPQNAGVTSLSVMAFLAKGHVPGSGVYGDVIDKGIDFILDNQKPNGMLIGRTISHGPMYGHMISTLMLSEASGMVNRARQKRVDDALAKALKLILAAQKVGKDTPAHAGGWRYQSDSRDSDLSCSGWAIMSLRSARNNGAAVPREAIDEALKFVMTCRAPDGGFGYQGPVSPGLARTGTALLCLELCGRHGDPAGEAAGQWILEHAPRQFGDTHFYYGMYYCAQGMFQLGGRFWQSWAETMVPMMLKRQQKDGSWPQGVGNEATAGPCYATAMGVLAMSVSYRQLPIYQR